ncbi:thioredoxin family protein [uncultured Desulfobacter sp.]|uniref:thioredoxin family protein n=1 Tax=uncultured Desulfobacter sp. TaxID=240139 RepID=UPI002AA6A368|nr:thioredoxin family protein [uncultured Desulfobacter sp.]
MEIKVLGPGCAKCSKIEKLVQEVIKETGVDASVEKVSDMLQIASYGVFGTPSVIVDGEVS